MKSNEKSIPLNNSLPPYSPRVYRSFTFVQDDDWRFPHYDAFSSNCHSEWTQECCMRKTENGTVTRSEESITLMTPYRLPHHGNRSFAAAQDDILRLSSPQRQTLHIRLGWQLTIFLPRVYRSFTFVQDDDWRFPHYDALPSPVILNGGKNAIWEGRKWDSDTEWRIYYADDVLPLTANS